MEILIQVVFLIIGFMLLMKGADWFVDGAAGFASKLGIPQLVIGLTIVAMGTSAPETAVSISSALKGNAEICIGNVVGSNIFNVLIILGITSVIVSLKVAKSTVKFEIPYMIFITIVLFLFGYTNGSISLLEGIVLWALFLIYFIYLFFMSKQQKSEENNEMNRPIWQLLFLTIVGMVLIVVGSNVTVDSATKIATVIGISERFIGLTIVSMGTSLPELVTSLTAARKGNADIAIGNIVGSNIFNILFVVGTTALITPVVFEPNFLVDTVIAAGTGVLLWLGVVKSKTLKRGFGILLLVLYAIYFLYLL